MRKFEWLMAIILIVAGLICLTISGTAILGPESINSYLLTLIQLCFWMGIPIIVVGILYFILLSKKKKGKNE
ncbi:hypothetical protein Q9251_22065 [Alkalihalobacillus macyae]|uniref:hypothetical protein n=1 Tax=Guptibacillus hwajinpoensis TaxID=208199 RepID=UPI00273AFA22|nr:hypothetical protein [Alkalihalobacillus macyae]MDP4553539.1 hypothetical protein [Alkalihalobacillus macyae]